MRRYSAWRDMPSACAARLTTPCAAASAASTAARGWARRGCARRAVRRAAGSPSRSTVIGRPPASSAARSITFFSSRTLPGHACARSASRAASPSSARPARKCSASGRMSSPRSASGGRRTSITLSR
jgi:hypothetical protein